MSSADQVSTAGTEATKLLSQPLTLPCGRVAPNRLAKAPMEEVLGKTGGGLPNEGIKTLYRAWAKARWGIVITGNVAIDKTHLGTPWDLALPAPPYGPEYLEAYKEYAEAASGRDANLPEGERPLVIVQLVHAGRQSMRGSGRSITQPSLAPSAVPMNPSSEMGAPGKILDWIIFGTCVAMTKAQIKEQIERFAASAELMSKAGFDGVEIHGSHGYQIAAFLSPRTNKRTDEYGGDAKGRARYLMEIIDAVRARVPKDFAVGVKLNSSDYVKGGLTEEDALQNVKWLAEHGGVDFVEISGGNYENPGFMMEGFDADATTRKLQGDSTISAPEAAQEIAASDGKKPSARTFAREAFFQNFARRAREVVPSAADGRKSMALIVTGGMRTRAGMASALEGGNVDAVAIGRMAAVYPALPRIVLDPSVPDLDPRASPAKYKMPGGGVLALPAIRMLGAGWTTFWHSGMMSFIARDEPVDHTAGTIKVLLSIFAPAVLKWRLQAFFIAILVALAAFSSQIRGKA